MIKKAFFTLLLLALVCLSAGAAVLYWYVAVEPGSEISREHIRSLLGRESPVLYNDGVTPLGVFFADAHRKYIEYEEIPQLFIDAIVAAEDNRYFSHFGFDIQGIARAAVKNIQAGRIVQGGSTLTQQTAKNLFKRQTRSIREKLKELLYALRLEYHYSKEQILEFYSNQFYVSGNGHGLGVAARYYFDKAPGELTLIEAAYIAGSVKRPNYYNPFIKKSEDGVRKARERARERVAYVLRKMRELAMIDEAEFQQAMRQEIPFKKGAVGYALDYVMEMVTDAVASERLTEALAVHGIDNISTSGIRIVTTVDRNLQDKTLYALRKQLSELDVRLRGYERETVQQELAATEYGGDREVVAGAFLFGTIRSVGVDGDETSIEVSFGAESGSGIIDRRGLETVVAARTTYQKNRWSEPAEEDLRDVLAQLKVGDRVWVSVRELPADGTALLDLERFPEVQGGAIVMREGRILAVAGGVENRFFNRAVYGRRTMGSSFKPFVYAAALQLGWNAADILDNSRNVFVYQNQPYFPRPDHAIESEEVSMSWAGVRSENLASVWLTYHLCDHLNRTQFEAVAGHLGLTPRSVDGEPEPYRLFRTRLRDRYGLVVDEETVRQAAYRKTLSLIGPDLIFEGLQGEQEAIMDLPYGRGFEQFTTEIEADLESGEAPESRHKELLLRRKILHKNFLSVSMLRGWLRMFLDDRVDRSTRFSRQAGAGDPDKAALYFDRATETYSFDLPEFAAAGAVRVDRDRIRAYLDGMDPLGRRDFVRRIKLAGIISVAAHDFIAGEVEETYRHMAKLLPYSMDVLEYVEEYRVLVGLHYLMAFGKALGIESELAPVLSFPLGSNVVTLLETTRIYEALATGKVTLFPEEGGGVNNTLAIIDRIESEDGMVLFRPEPVANEVISAKTSLVLGHILENTVKFGTGRYADREVKLTGGRGGEGELADLGLSVPLLGKTGTANRYTNASFYGYLPALNSEGNGMDIRNGYAVGVYVGYDDNKPMRRRTTRITGAAGALPAWTDIVKTLIREKEYAHAVDPVDLTFYGLNIRRDDLGQINLDIDSEAGGTVILPPHRVDVLDRYHPSIITFGTARADGTLELDRQIVPFWRVPEEGPRPLTVRFRETDL